MYIYEFNSFQIIFNAFENKIFYYLHIYIININPFDVINLLKLPIVKYYILPNFQYLM